VIAYLAVSLVAGVLLGQSAQTNPIVVGVIVLLGGLVYADIMRRERRRSSADSAPTA
jgi:ABC-type cobalamin transport system permease subunit